VRLPRSAAVQTRAHGNAARFHLPDGPEQRARDAAMASSFGLSPDIGWLYGHDVEAEAKAPQVAAATAIDGAPGATARAPDAAAQGARARDQ
jgi:hypothetical protein